MPKTNNSIPTNKSVSARQHAVMLQLKANIATNICARFVHALTRLLGSYIHGHICNAHHVVWCLNNNSIRKRRLTSHASIANTRRVCDWCVCVHVIIPTSTPHKLPSSEHEQHDTHTHAHKPDCHRRIRVRRSSHRILGACSLPPSS